MKRGILAPIGSRVGAVVAAVFWACFSAGITGATAAPEPPDVFTVASDGTNLQVTFETVVGQTYAVEKSTTLAQGDWTQTLAGVAGTGAPQTITDAGAGTLPRCFYRIRYSGDPMALIPAGSFSMGNALSAAGDGYSWELPVHTVNVSAFYMQKTLVTKAQWDEVYAWAVANGYGFTNAGVGKAPGHPVHTVAWYDCVKWCNARSEKEGLVPSYTVGGAIYRTGNSAPDCNMSVNGYRLPTETEWEKAARGGLSGKRFPWGDTIDQSQANYQVLLAASGSANKYAFDVNPTYPAATLGYHPTYATGGVPYTSPVGSFPANGYGLYDMAGNLSEWCNDWFFNGPYGSGSLGDDPTGPASGTIRIARGGNWYVSANLCRVSNRSYGAPSFISNNIGFRCVRR